MSNKSEHELNLLFLSLVEDCNWLVLEAAKTIGLRTARESVPQISTAVRLRFLQVVRGALHGLTKTITSIQLAWGISDDQYQEYCTAELQQHIEKIRASKVSK